MNPRLKHLLVQLLPPFIITAAKRIRDLRNQLAPRINTVPPADLVSTQARAAISVLRHIVAPEPPEWEAVPDSDAVWSAHEGWSHQSIAETQRQRWPSFLATIEGKRPFGWHETKPGTPVDVNTHNTIITFGYILGFAAAARKKVSVLDWGGGLGQYYLYSRRLRPDLELDYVVKDLPTLCAVGREVNPEVKFISDDDEALLKRYDLVFASSSLQYTRDYYGQLARICDATAGCLMITRSPFVEQHEDFVVIQRPYKYGYLTEYPAWFINRHRFIAFIENRGFVFEREFMLGERPFVPNAPEHCLFCGFLFKRAGS
jgi:putative methyltransferase (TIGR04325 family)